MKKILFLALSVAAAALSACSHEEPPPRHVYHHYRRDSGPAINAPTDQGADNFHAVTRPDSYSGQ